MAMERSELQAYLEHSLKRHLPVLDPDQAMALYDGAVDGGEVTQCGSIKAWLEDRASFATVILDHMDYLTALTHSLRIAPNLAPTDYGTSRQRDLGQLWMDVARGFLGEIGLARFVRERFEVELILDYTLGPIEDYLPSDIKRIRLSNGQEVETKLKVSFKTTKFSGVWLDIPGAQLGHSDVFVLIKLGISREHFVAFLKWISFIRDKLLPRAMESGTIDQTQATELWNSLPELKPIPCYICGFLDRRLRESPPTPQYRPKHTRDGKLKGYLMKNYAGWVRHRIPQGIPEELKSANWEFQSIGTFSAADHFVVNAGSLSYSQNDWRRLIRELTEGVLR